MIHVKAIAPSLSPKTNTEDMQKLQDFYSFLYERLADVEAEMEQASCEGLMITVGEKEGPVVENSKVQEPLVVLDVAKTIAALRKKGLTDTQICDMLCCLTK